MHRRALLASGLGLAACAAHPSSPSAALDAGASAASGFDANLYRAIATGPDNVFISPYSVESAFALLYPGARGNTAAEIAAAMGFAANPEAQITRSRAQAEALRAETGGSDFTTASAAWVERTMALRAAYARSIGDGLGATIEAVDFIADQQAALARINGWTAERTRDRIREIISGVDPARRLVLTNAVYFKGRWSDPFPARATRDGSFFTQAGERTASLMRQETRARYVEQEGFQAAEFDYDQGAFALSVFLPRQRDGLAQFEQRLTGAQLDQWLTQLDGADRVRLDVTLPKVTMESSYNLNAPLQALGVRAAFSNAAADLSGIADASLVVSAVIQKTFLAIDEDGTVAAAVTGIDVAVTSAPVNPPPPPIEFKADHPFFMVLRHRPSGVRLFLGRVANPAA